MEPNNNQPSAASRRHFLAAGSAAVAGAALASNALAQENANKSSAAFGDNPIKVGLIGCGGRGTDAMGQIFNTPGPIKLVAMADAFDYRMNSALRRFESTVKKRAASDGGQLSDYFDVPEERRGLDLDGYKRVLDSDCDLVVMATPPGFRPEQFEAAIDAGKHVFMEKPVATDAPGIRRVLAAGEKAKEKGLAVAVGLQRRHEPKYLETIDLLHKGIIGDIVLSRVYWNSGGVWTRPRTAEQNEMQYQVENWYYFNWLCGDNITEQHIHNLDVGNWAKGMLPVEAQGQGGREVRTSKENGQIFDHHMVEYTYNDGTKMISQCRHIEGCAKNVSEHVHGTAGTADISAGQIFGPRGDLLWEYEGRNPQGHQQEQTDLIANLRSGKLPNETEYGAHSTMTSILGRMATYSGKVVKWDEAINSDLVLVPNNLTFASQPPVKPDDEGRYPVPVPGKTRAV